MHIFKSIIPPILSTGSGKKSPISWQRLRAQRVVQTNLVSNPGFLSPDLGLFLIHPTAPSLISPSCFMLLWSPTSQGRLLVQGVHTASLPARLCGPSWHLETREGQGYILPPYPHPHAHPAQETELCSLRPIPPSVTSLAHTEPVACRMSSCLPETPKRIWWGVGGRNRQRYQEGPAGGEGISLGNEPSWRGIFLERERPQRARSTD